MRLTTPLKQIVWGVDILAGETRIDSAFFQMQIHNLVLGASVLVDWVYILNPKSFNTPLKDFPEWIDFYKTVISEDLQQFSRGMNWNFTSKTKVLATGTESIKVAARLLLDYSVQTGSELIVVMPRKKNFPILRSYGFSDYLIQNSKIPIFLLRRQALDTRPIQTILYPTILGSEITTDAMDVIDFAGFLGATLILFHNPPWPSLLAFPHSNPSPTEYADSPQIQDTLQHWEKLAASRGTPLKVEINTTPGVWLNQILQKAKETQADLIVISLSPLTSFKSNIQWPYLKILRQSPCSILILPKISCTKSDQ